MDDIAKALSKLSFKKLLEIAEKEGVKKSGKKKDVLRRLLEEVPAEKLRGYILESSGISPKILEHELVPKHRIMNPEEVEELLKKYGIKKWQLPKILATDPVVVLLGAKEGDVLEITRKSPTAGEAKYYRVVVAAEE